ncbi:MAG: hypothetical protein P4L39_06460 [Humidesulfovibrio sp.]|nr:hypothetical protein [Humidesulfovibrio sp.]
MLMWIHPTLQTLALLISLFVLYLGIARFRFAHLGHRGIVFQWKRHVALGTVVLTTWGLFFGIGLGMAWRAWRIIGITQWHFAVALTMLPLIAFGLASGIVMNRLKAKRRLLPLAHGAVNTLLVALALWQLCTGIIILRDMVLV